MDLLVGQTHHRLNDKAYYAKGFFKREFLILDFIVRVFGIINTKQLDYISDRNCDIFDLCGNIKAFLGKKYQDLYLN